MLNNLQSFRGHRHKRKRLGRGKSSGHGGTSTKGHKGQRARSGFGLLRGFEGGQMPLVRSLPKFGFTNKRFKKHYVILNLSDLNLFLQGATLEDSSSYKADKNHKNSNKIRLQGATLEDSSKDNKNHEQGANQNGGFLAEIHPEMLYKAGWAKKGALIKILGTGQLNKPLKVSAHHFSQSALSAIEKAGGQIKKITDSKKWVKDKPESVKNQND